MGCLMLQAPNGAVRANAAAVLFDVFPLRDPDAEKPENDTLRQKQFDIFNVRRTSTIASETS